MLDTARQSWQPVAAHPEVRAAWIERSRFRPPSGTGLVLPALPAMAAVAAGGEDEAAQRREAFARVVRGLPPREAIPPEDRPRPGRTRGAILALVGAAVVLGLIGWGMVLLAIKLTAMAARAAGVVR